MKSHSETKLMCHAEICRKIVKLDDDQHLLEKRLTRLNNKLEDHIHKKDVKIFDSWGEAAILIVIMMAIGGGLHTFVTGVLDFLSLFIITYHG